MDYSTIYILGYIASFLLFSYMQRNSTIDSDMVVSAIIVASLLSWVLFLGLLHIKIKGKDNVE